MLDVRRLSLLRDLADHGTVSAVADVHRVTPSAVSQQLRQLEHEAGVALLHREGRSVRLTAAGRTLVAGTEDVFAALERAETRLRRLADRPSGPVRIACFTSALGPLAAPLPAALRAAHPELVPAVHEAEPEHSLPALRQQRADVAVVYHYTHLGAEAPSWAHTVPLLDDPLAVVLPDGHPVAGADATAPVDLRDLADADWIAAPEGGSCRDATLLACRHAGFTPRTVHTCADFGATLTLVGAGAGVALVPRLALTSPPPGVRAYDVGAPSVGRSVEAVVRRGAAGHPAIGAVLGALADAASSRPAGRRP
ncbi:LysR family transcriptional regulator [Streptomyces sp. RKND-216]|uniref:LysR family transcriptional regulator n=1 Tax=Streptomyces sp. RKND-216 TaxID=2562581 RepID=UPI00109E3232|nr:LysR family transcriptional regulator [Streptomyces sp. RKND-216]THA26235.1 LysR family transcriptional regulator [Streptomyces sp. RKND-216]